MTDDTTDTNDTFTTDSSPGEQTYESKIDDAVAFIETMFDSSEASAHRRSWGTIASGIRWNQCNGRIRGRW
jgi:hypothetical protein